MKYQNCLEIKEGERIIAQEKCNIQTLKVSSSFCDKIESKTTKKQWKTKKNKMKNKNNKNKINKIKIKKSRRDEKSFVKMKRDRKILHEYEEKRILCQKEGEKREKRGKSIRKARFESFVFCLPRVTPKKISKTKSKKEEQNVYRYNIAKIWIYFA